MKNDAQTKLESPVLELMSTQAATPGENRGKKIWRKFLAPCGFIVPKSSSKQNEK
ncbi:MAG: hypothetical protein MHPSP_004718, partial [Paramarteilia canceri]